MDSLAIQRSLTILEDRYRELREIGEKRFATFESESETLHGELRVAKEEKEGLAGELRVVKEEKEGLAGELRVAKEEKEGLAGELRVVKRELANAQEEAELCLLQLHQVQEELEYYFLETRRQAEKLHWLRGQRELLIRMLRLQGRKLREFMVVDGRIVMPALKRQCQPWWQRIARL
jgi:uncharacterized protein (DUF3084 family)